MIDHPDMMAAPLPEAFASILSGCDSDAIRQGSQHRADGKNRHRLLTATNSLSMSKGRGAKIPGLSRAFFRRDLLFREL
jgi:hypothetical protein